MKPQWRLLLYFTFTKPQWGRGHRSHSKNMLVKLCEEQGLKRGTVMQCGGYLLLRSRSRAF